MKKSFLFAVLIMIFSVLACKMPNFLSKSEESNSNSVSTQKENSEKEKLVTVSENPREDIIKASKKFSQQDAFQATMDGKGEKNMHMKIAFIAPDRYHINNAPSMELIIIGKSTYMKLNGKWQKSPVNMGDSIPKMRDAFNEEGLKSLGEVEYVGEDSVDGKTALLYRYKGNTVKDATAYDSKLWVGKDNGLPLKIEVKYPNGGALKEMTTVYDYDKAITIESPTGN